VYICTWWCVVKKIQEEEEEGKCNEEDGEVISKGKKGNPY
jgi:hypothetical protein